MADHDGAAGAGVTGWGTCIGCRRRDAEPLSSTCAECQLAADEWTASGPQPDPERMADRALRRRKSRNRTPPGRPHTEGRLVLDPLDSALQSEADARTRTGDPFITREGSMSNPVTPGHSESPDVVTNEATPDTNRQGERPRDAPTNTGRP